MMTYPELKIGDLTVKKPIIQGGMGIGISLSELAGAVAKAGGVGVISTARLVFGSRILKNIRRKPAEGPSAKNWLKQGKLHRRGSSVLIS